ncbi:glutathione S-transferase [alpha proteobacterium U9-1i]|nr:glutathione S-transferase [alpha proteobacterium U9-1i]
MANGIKLYGDSVSGNCLKCKWVAEALGIPFDWIETDIMVGGSRTPEFLAMNPAGQVPAAILPDGRALAQSNAIMLYLAEGSRLIPRDPYARAKMFEWLFWEQYSHEPQIAVRRFLITYLKKSVDEIPATLLPKGEAALARMELQLTVTPYFVGHDLTLADIALVAYTRVAHEGGYDLNKFPAVKAWVARVEADLALKPAA